jgi:hypothetical protein
MLKLIGFWYVLCVVVVICPKQVLIFINKYKLNYVLL